MSEQWMMLLEKISPELQHGKDTLEKIAFLLEKCFFNEIQKAILKETAEKVLADPLLLENYTKCLTLLEEGIDQGFSGRINDSLLEETFPAELCTAPIPQETFLLLLAVSCIPAGEKAFAKQKIPVEKLYEALDEYRSWCDNCTRNQGVTGLLYGHGFAWLVFRILPGIVLRFGRLEYNKCLFFPEILVFKHRKTGRIIPLLNGIFKVDQEGKLAGEEEKDFFMTSIPGGIFGSYTGNYVLSDGKISREKICVDLEEYEILLRPGDEVLYMHIPELGPLTAEKVEDSFRQVKEFYSREDSPYHPRGIICGSWLFDPVLQDLLPENANLPLFQKSGFLLPPKVPHCDVVFRVFGSKGVQEGVSSVEWKSSLQKVLGKYLLEGGIFRGGRYFRMF